MFSKLKLSLQEKEFKKSLKNNAVEKRENILYKAKNILYKAKNIAKFKSNEELIKYLEIDTSKKKFPSFHGRRIDDFLNKFIPETFNYKQPKLSTNILDVWAWEWHLVEYLKNLWWNKTIGIDKKNIQSNNIIKWDVRSLPFKDNSYHTVTSTLLFDKYARYWNYSFDWATKEIQQLLMYDEIMRVLKPWWFYIWREERSTQKMVLKWFNEHIKYNKEDGQENLSKKWIDLLLMTQIVGYKTISIEEYSLKKIYQYGFPERIVLYYKNH